MFNSSERGVIFVFLIVGIPFFGAGILIGRLTTGHEQSAARIEEFSPATTTGLADTPPGQEVLIEGRVSRSNPTQLRSFMAYIEEAYHPDSDSNDDDDDAYWVEQDRVTPPLLLELAGGGPVQIEHSGYRLETTKIIDEGGNIRYRVLEANDPIVAVGLLVSTAEPPRLAAEFIALGDQAEYIAAQRSAATTTRLMSLIFMTLGGIFIVIGLVVGVRSWQRS